MTLIIGIICKDAIVLASDSQTTKQGTKRIDAEKLVPVDFSDGRVLVGQAGNAGNAARALEILREMAKGRPIDDYRIPADLAQRAMTQVKHELRQQYCNCTMEKLRNFIWKDELQSEFMLAYYFRNKPYLFTVDLAVGRADKETSWCGAIGCGANLGSFLLSEYTTKGMNAGLASIMASYVIETVCKHDAYCSPPAKVGLIISDVVGMVGATLPPQRHIHPTAYGAGLVVIQSSNTVAAQAKRIEAIMESERRRRNTRIERFLARQLRESMKEFERLLAQPTPKRFKKFGKRFGGISHLEFLKPTQPEANTKPI